MNRNPQIALLRLLDDAHRRLLTTTEAIRYWANFNFIVVVGKTPSLFVNNLSCQQGMSTTSHSFSPEIGGIF
jgi:hypothetical protein